MFSLKKIGIWLAIWGFVKTIWDTIGHIGNVQTLWDMISAAVQYWPSFLRGTLWVVTSWWFPLIASTICLVLWWFLSRAEKKFAGVTFGDARFVPSEQAPPYPPIGPIASPQEEKLPERIQAALREDQSPKARQLKALKDKLANLLNKRERLASHPEQAHDANASIRRNERFIGEVRAEIAKLEAETQFSAHPFTMRPIQIRDELDKLVRDGEDIFQKWLTADVRSDEQISDVRQLSQQWLQSTTVFVKNRFDIKHVDLWEDYAMTIQAVERYKIAFNLAKAGKLNSAHPIAYELGYKVQILRQFRKDIG